MVEDRWRLLQRLRHLSRETATIVAIFHSGTGVPVAWQAVLRREPAGGDSRRLLRGVGPVQDVIDFPDEGEPRRDLPGRIGVEDVFAAIWSGRNVDVGRPGWVGEIGTPGLGVGVTSRPSAPNQ